LPCTNSLFGNGLPPAPAIPVFPAALGFPLSSRASSIVSGYGIYPGNGIQPSHADFSQFVVTTHFSMGLTHTFFP